jgi:hypothetical protein
MVKSMNIVNEATAIGKKIFSDAKGKLFFGYQNDDDTIQFVDYKTWKKLPMKDLSNEFLSNRVINSIVRNQKQFNKKVEYNMWSKKTNPSFEDRMDYFIKNGWISNITKAGIRESVKSINESLINEDSSTAFLILINAAIINGILFGQIAANVGFTPIKDLKAWWQKRKSDKALKSIINKIKGDEDVIKFMKLTPAQQRGKFRSLIATKLSDNELDYLNKINRSHFKKESVNEASLSDIDIIAQEAKDFKDFVKEFYKEYKDFAKTKEALKWLEDIYKNRSKMEGLERVASGLPQTEEEPISENSLSDLEKKLKSHDWWFAYSDDGSKYRRGSDNWNELTSMLKSLKGPQAEKLFNKYVPDGFSPTYKKLVESNSTPMNEDFRMGFRNIIHLIPTGYAPNDPKYKSELRYLINTLNNFYKERGYDRKILSIY